MDSITQGLLGATTFAFIKDKDIGKKSLIIGAAAGTIPDLDVFLAPLFNDVEFLSVHRSVSHSVILAVGLSFALGYLFHRIYKKQHKLSSWNTAFFLAIMTHSLLDWCTTYGTKLLSPFTDHLFSTNNIHVFEPIYTLILLIGTSLLVFKKLSIVKRRNIILWTLCLSTLYLSWTFVSKGIANEKFVAALDNQNINFDQLIVSPTPLNSVLWHGIAKTQAGFYLGSYSLFDRRSEVEFHFVRSENDIIKKIKDNRLIKYYLEYTQDFPLIISDAVGNIKIYAIKYGPINYFGEPKFIHPLTFNSKKILDEHIKIEYEENKKGPIRNYKNLIKRIKGI